MSQLDTLWMFCRLVFNSRSFFSSWDWEKLTMACYSREYGGRDQMPGHVHRFAPAPGPSSKFKVHVIQARLGIDVQE